MPEAASQPESRELWLHLCFIAVHSTAILTACIADLLHHFDQPLGICGPFSDLQQKLCGTGWLLEPPGCQTSWKGANGLSQNRVSLTMCPSHWNVWANRATNPLELNSGFPWLRQCPRGSDFLFGSRPLKGSQQQPPRFYIPYLFGSPFLSFSLRPFYSEPVGIGFFHRPARPRPSSRTCDMPEIFPRDGWLGSTEKNRRRQLLVDVGRGAKT